MSSLDVVGGRLGGADWRPRLRFYDLDSGRILCDGEDIAQLGLHAYWNHLLLVAQEPTLFQGEE